MERDKWSVGFLFKDKKEVALVLKTRPAWQVGKWNGVGGHIEENETPAAAMRREFLEEAGVDIADWRKFAVMEVQDGAVHFFVAHGDYPIRTTTDETVAWHKLEDIKNLPTVNNLGWLIPLGLDPGTKSAVIEYFQSQQKSE